MLQAPRAAAASRFCSFRRNLFLRNLSDGRRGARSTARRAAARCRRASAVIVKCLQQDWPADGRRGTRSTARRAAACCRRAPAVHRLSIVCRQMSV